jgi:uncharacterized membrane protein YhaH (DUF805 family)
MKRYFSFQGRMNRLSYLWGFLVVNAICFFLTYISTFLKSVPNIYVGPLLGLLLLLPGFAIVVLIFWFWLAISAQRLHDIGFSNWYLIALLILSPIVELMLLIKKGDAGENQYGADPLMKKVT